MTHVSALTLDALDLGLLAAEEAAAAEAHLAGCDRCRADRELQRAARLRFEREVEARTLPEVIRRHHRRRSLFRRTPWLLALPAVAAAAGLLVLLSWGSPLLEHQEILVKGGGPALHAYAKRGERVFAVRDGAQLLAGDDLRFVVEPGGHRYVLIASIDGAAQATVYHPYGGAASAELCRGARVVLPGSIHLDDAPGPERVFAVYSDTPLDAAPLLEELRELGRRGGDAIRAQKALPGNAAQATVWFEKARQ